MTLYPFRENRRRLLTGDPRTSEMMQPYAWLRVSVARGRNLRWKERSFWLGSEPCLQVFVNDVLKAESCPALSSRSPEWNFDATLDVYSPLSIVRLAVVDRRPLARKALIGFVEFRVGELEPGGTQVSGWFELRSSEHFVGKADARFQRHRAARDDCEDQHGDARAGSLVSRLRSYSLGHGGAERTNAGELRASLRLDAQSPQSSSQARHPSWLLLLSAAVFCPSALPGLNLTDEWHACCFPRPRPERARQGEESGSWLYVRVVSDLLREVCEVRAIILDQLARKVASIFLYVVCWRCWPLSLFVLAHWCLCSIFPACLVPSLPLLAALLLRLLRDPSWRQALLVHEATAPLNGEGLAMAAGLDSSERVARWLQRVVCERGGRVLKAEELHEFTKLTFHNGRPTLSYPALLRELRAKPWIAWSEEPERRCPGGHELEPLGPGSYQQAPLWRCSGRGLSRACPVAARARESLHLGVHRYHCAVCRLDLCDSCALGREDSSLLLKLQVPTLGLETIRELVLDGAEIVRAVKEPLVALFQRLDRLLHPAEELAAGRVYAGCVALFAALVGVQALLRSSAAWMLHALVSVFWLLVGANIFIQKTVWARRLKTVCRANWDYRCLLACRAEGGCRQWAFLARDGAA